MFLQEEGWERSECLNSIAKDGLLQTLDQMFQAMGKKYCEERLELKGELECLKKILAEKEVEAAQKDGAIAVLKEMLDASDKKAMGLHEAVVQGDGIIADLERKLAQQTASTETRVVEMQAEWIRRDSVIEGLEKELAEQKEQSETLRAEMSSTIATLEETIAQATAKEEDVREKMTDKYNTLCYHAALLEGELETERNRARDLDEEHRLESENKDLKSMLSKCGACRKTFEETYENVLGLIYKKRIES